MQHLRGRATAPLLAATSGRRRTLPAAGTGLLAARTPPGEGIQHDALFRGAANRARIPAVSWTSAAFGYQGRWAWVDLTERRVRVEPADVSICRDYLGGRGVQARLMLDVVRDHGPVLDPLSPSNRLVLGTGPLNDTRIATAGRGSCTFVSPLTRSPGPAPWVRTHQPLHGLLTHSSAGGVCPNMLKRAGFDQLVIDGRAERPVRLLVAEEGIRILDAEDDLFETVDGERSLRGASAVTNWLTGLYPGSATMAVGPAGWRRVACACLTGDHHRNFGRGGAGAVCGSKNLVAITAFGRRRTTPFDPAAFEAHARKVDELVLTRTTDPHRTASFRPATGTTWWLDRAFDGRYMGKAGGYLPWHNFDEGYFDPAQYAEVGTDSFLEIAGRHVVCNRCRHVKCSREARVERGPFAGRGVRPEFETVALWVNCCILDREAIFHLNGLCNSLGVDTMTFGSMAAAAMELTETGLLDGWPHPPRFGSAGDMLRILHGVAYQSSDIGQMMGSTGDAMVARAAARRPASDLEAIAACVTTAFGGLGYAGIEPKVFPGMFAAYATSNRGRGDHTCAWTVQAEEDGLSDPGQLAAYVAESQAAKAIVDSVGLCDFFPGDIMSDLFLAMYAAATSCDLSAGWMLDCGRRIYSLERHINAVQGRSRAYDAFVPRKFEKPMSDGAHAGRAVEPLRHNAILDAYYGYNGWTREGIPPAPDAQSGIPRPVQGP
jgi:aldehyde:ferredoxin oxidoreductase